MMRNSLGSIILRVIFVFCVCLLVVNLFRRVSGFNSNFNFANLMTNLSNSDSMKLTFDISSFQIGGNWGIVDGIRQFFNAFATILGVLIWLGTNLINLILFLAQFARILFI